MLADFSRKDSTVEPDMGGINASLMDRMNSTDTALCRQRHYSALQMAIGKPQIFSSIKWTYPQCRFCRLCR